MEYERIHKVQTGIISPSKLRMKLLGLHQQMKNDSSNNNSSKTSPSKHDDSQFLKNSLLDVDNQGQHSMISTMQPSENDDSRKIIRGDNANTASVHPVKACDDENLDYDSTSSFEFHKERSNHHRVARSFSRPMSSKWNDAEKWIKNKQNVLPAASKKMHFQNQSQCFPPINTGRVVPETVNNYNKPVSEKNDFIFNGSHSMSAMGKGENNSIDLCVDSKLLSCAKGLTENNSGISNSTVRSVCMRDTGTEMTPIPSQEPSRTATPEGSTTPISSIPSTPHRNEPTPTPTKPYLIDASDKTDVSDKDLKLKTRQEIVALGVQLGKMNIAANWAKMDDKEKESTIKNGVCEEIQQIEFAKIAAAWEEVENSKHNARFKHEEIKIQAWESQQKAKFDAEMRKTEAKVEKMRVKAQADMVNKIAILRQKSEEKRVAAEARKNHQAKKAAAQADYIRKKGQLPSCYYRCCGWF